MGKGRKSTAKSAWAVLGVAASVLAACGSSTAPKGATTAVPSGTYVMKIAAGSAPGDSGGVTLLKFKAMIEQQTSGAVQVQIFNNGILGSPNQTLDETQNGSVTAFVGSSPAVTPIVPYEGILDLPFLFDNVGAMDKTLAGPIGQNIDQGLSAQGITVLGWFNNSSRDMYGNFGPLTEPSQLKGKRIRVLASPIFDAYFKALGVVISNIVFPEVYLALEQHTIDGVETSFGPALSMKQDQVAQDWILTHHAFSPLLFGVNKNWLSSLPETFQNFIKEDVAKLIPGQQAVDAQDYNKTIAQLKSEGKTIVTPDDAAFRAAARPIWAKFSSSYGGVPTLNSVLTSEGEQPLPLPTPQP
jgi:tripartite ATP-independent transporter DctP family solute receptor